MIEPNIDPGVGSEMPVAGRIAGYLVESFQHGVLKTNPGEEVKIIPIVGEEVEETVKKVLDLVVQAKLASNEGKDIFTDMYQATFEFSNYGIGAVSALTAGRSAIQFIYCTNPAARRFYAMSVAFSSVATTSGCMAGYARVCSLSRTAMATETIGFIFMRLGDMTLNAAKAAEGNRKIFQQRQGRRWGYSGSGVSFVVPPACNYRLSSVIEKIPFQRIGQVVGFTISVYFYGKLLFRVYGYGKQIRGKSQSRYRTLNVRKASIQLIRSFNSCTQVSRIFAVYKLAIS